jgi:hypothetical protein
MTKDIVLPAERWKHRLIVRMNAPVDAPDGVWTDEMLRDRIGTPVPPLELFGEDRVGYFLADFVLQETAETALLTLDFYDLEGIELPPLLLDSLPLGSENDDRKGADEAESRNDDGEDDDGRPNVSG